MPDAVGYVDEMLPVERLGICGGQGGCGRVTRLPEAPLGLGVQCEHCNTCLSLADRGVSSPNGYPVRTRWVSKIGVILGWVEQRPTSSFTTTIAGNDILVTV
jgi:hypothetical protein